MTGTIETYVIKLVRPDDVSINEMKDFVKDACRHWGGQFEPYFNPLFEGVEIKSMVRQK